MSDVKGIDQQRVADWMVANTPPVEPPLTFDLIAGGRSNLTYRVTDSAGRAMVLRRPPVSHVLATAHDMGREHTIISALYGSAVPVPKAVGFCADTEVNGAPFYVMDFVDGHILQSAEQVESLWDEATQRSAADNLVDGLVALHGTDPDSVGLGDLGKKEDYVGRQLRRWYGQFQSSQEQAREGGVFREADIVHEVHDELVARKPAQLEAVIAHGDYRLDNCIFATDGTLAAVLDWELCTLGDPLADLATMMVYYSERGDGGYSLSAASTAPGFPTRAELAARYAEKSGRDTTLVPYYAAFAHWRLACIMEGVYVRYASGAMGDEHDGATGLADEVVRRCGLARDSLALLDT